MTRRKSHAETVNAALAEIERLSAAGLVVTPSSVAKGAGISRSNLYKRDGARSKGWNNVIKAIEAAKNEAISPPESSKTRTRDAEVRELRDRIKRFEAILIRLDTLSTKTFRTLLDNYILYWKKDRDRSEELAQLGALLEEVTANQRHIRELEATNRVLSAGRKLPERSPKVSHLSQKVIICPDNYLLDDKGVYAFSRHRANEAWQKAILDVDDQLKQRVPSIVYVLSGPQGAGKTTWAAQHRPTAPGVSLYFDATLPFSSDRAALVVRARRVGARIACIRFLTSLEKCIRNSSSRELGRQIPEKVIRDVFDAFEEISVDEGFDEIHMIREKIE